MERNRRPGEEPSAPRALPREETGLSRPHVQGPVVVLREPVRRYARAERAARVPGHARQFRPQRRAERDLRAEGARRRRRDVVRRRRSRGVVRAHRQVEPAARRRPGVRADAVHQGRGRAGTRPVRLPRSARRPRRPHDAGRRAMDVRTAPAADGPAVVRRLPRRRLRAAARRPLHPPLQAEDSGRAGALARGSAGTMTGRTVRGWLAAAAVAIVIAAPASAAASPAMTAPDQTSLPAQLEEPRKGAVTALDPVAEISEALIRLPLAALLGVALALRPRRRGTPPRQPAVVQTQIILAIVGALVMMVVGTNLARAFGVVGAAGLVRYRAKIEDPKDAGVMLSTLALGLASGVGLYVIAVFSAGFILVALWVIESFEPHSLKRFDVKVKIGKQTDELRPRIEAILRRHRVQFELRTSSDEEVCYDVSVPLGLQTDRVSNDILKLDPKGHAAGEWSEKKKAK
ncbi:MAG: hypothetical protein DMF86_17485 [Acidobacteria bacterium]|nr:MAG: hypothetical protein DMF86_17485 [Acidobacteriota bacterium]